jgi:hypothetical protein
MAAVVGWLDGVGSRDRERDLQQGDDSKERDRVDKHVQLDI